MLLKESLTDEQICQDLQMCPAGAMGHLEYEGETNFSMQLSKCMSVTRNTG